MWNFAEDSRAEIGTPSRRDHCERLAMFIERATSAPPRPFIIERWCARTADTSVLRGEWLDWIKSKCALANSRRAPVSRRAVASIAR